MGGGNKKREEFSSNVGEIAGNKSDGNAEHGFVSLIQFLKFTLDSRGGWKNYKIGESYFNDYAAAVDVIYKAAQEIGSVKDQKSVKLSEAYELPARLKAAAALIKGLSALTPKQLEAAASKAMKDQGFKNNWTQEKVTIENSMTVPEFDGMVKVEVEVVKR